LQEKKIFKNLFLQISQHKSFLNRNILIKWKDFANMIICYSWWELHRFAMRLKLFFGIIFF